MVEHPTSFVIVCTLLFSGLTALSSAQIPTTYSQYRGFKQQRFSIEFISSWDSLRLIYHKRGASFFNIDAVDGFMNDFRRAWEKSAGTVDTNYLRIDSHVYMLIAFRERKNHWQGDDSIDEYIYQKCMVPSFLADVAYCSSDPEPRKRYTSD